MCFFNEEKLLDVDSFLCCCLELNFAVIASEPVEIGSKKRNNLILTTLRSMNDFQEKISGMTYYNKIILALAKNFDMKYIKILFQKNISGDSAMFMCDIDLLQKNSTFRMDYI